MSADLCLIVTGASGFLGKAIVDFAVKDPRVSHVIAVHRRPCGKTKGNCENLGSTNLATDAGIARLQRKIERRSESKLALVHCAGDFPALSPLHAVPLTDLRTTIDNNLTSFLGAMKASLPSMRRNGWGKLLAFSSHARIEHYPYMGAFNLAKAALESAVRTAANENARFGISANTILIATLKTDTERGLKPKGSFDDWLEPSDVASFSLDIISTEGCHLNGSLLHYWQHSDSFFGQSAFERNSIDMGKIDP